MSNSRQSFGTRGTVPLGRIGTPKSTIGSSISSNLCSALSGGETPSSNSNSNSSSRSSLNTSSSRSSSSSSTSSSMISSSRSLGTGKKRKPGMPVNDSLMQTDVTHNERTIKMSKIEKVHALKEAFGVDNFTDLKPSQRSIVFAVLSEETLWAYASSTGTTTMEQFIPRQTLLEKAIIRKSRNSNAGVKKSWLEVFLNNGTDDGHEVKLEDILNLQKANLIMNTRILGQLQLGRTVHEGLGGAVVRPVNNLNNFINIPQKIKQWWSCAWAMQARAFPFCPVVGIGGNEDSDTNSIVVIDLLKKFEVFGPDPSQAPMVHLNAIDGRPTNGKGWVTAISTAISDQKRSNRKVFTGYLKKRFKQHAWLYNAAFMTACSLDENGELEKIVLGEPPDEFRLTAEDNIHSIYNLTLVYMKKTTPDAYGDLLPSVATDKDDISEAAGAIEEAGGNFVSVASIWFFLIVKTGAFRLIGSAGSCWDYWSAPFDLFSRTDVLRREAQTSLLWFLANELLKMKKMNPDLPMPGIEDEDDDGDSVGSDEDDDSSIDVKPDIKSIHNLKFPVTLAAAQNFVGTQLQAHGKGYNFLPRLYKSKGGDDDYADCFYFRDIVRYDRVTMKSDVGRPTSTHQDPDEELLEL